MPERLPVTSEIPTNPELGDKYYFELADIYAEALLDRQRRSQAVTTWIVERKDGTPGSETAVFNRTMRGGFEIKFYDDSPATLRLATFESGAEDSVEVTWFEQFEEDGSPKNGELAPSRSFTDTLTDIYGKLPYDALQAIAPDTTQ